MIEDFPETVVYSRPFNDWISRPRGLYTLDPHTDTGWALDCETRNVPYHRHYATFRHRLRRFLGSRADFACCLDGVDTWCRLFLLGWDRLDACPAGTGAPVPEITGRPAVGPLRPTGGQTRAEAR